MPSLKDLLAVKSIPGYAESETPNKPSPVVQPGSSTSPINPYRRCPLPPFNAGSDTLRQFDESGKVPARRVIPLPSQTAGQGGNVTNVTNVTTTTSGTSSSSSTTSPASSSTSFSVPALDPGQNYTTTVPLAKSFRLLLLNATNAVEVRLYSTALAQTVDIARTTDTAPPFETTQGLITDVVFDSSPYQWSWADRGGANADNPQSTTIYVTVVNPSSTTGIGATVVSITFVPQES
jgi:hypothetical protein